MSGCVGRTAAIQRSRPRASWAVGAGGARLTAGGCAAPPTRTRARINVTSTCLRVTPTRRVTATARRGNVYCSAEATGNAAFPLAPETLCEKAREFVETGSAYFSPAREELYSEEFVFRGPVIGPLCKRDYLSTLGTFKIYEAFPDIQSNAWGYCVDPTEPNRVRFFIRQTGTNTGPINLAPPLPPLEATNRAANVGPEAYSILFDEEGKVKLLTVGYPVDFDAPASNSNKYGAVVGLLAAVGIALPGGGVFTAAQKATRKLQQMGVVDNKTIFVSKWDDVPAWYKAYVPRREGSEGAPGY